MTSDQLKEDIVRKVSQTCIPWATTEQRRSIEASLTIALQGVTLSVDETALTTDFAMSNEDYLRQFQAIKMVKGLSPRTLVQYTYTIQHFFQEVPKPVPSVTSNDIRYFLAVRKQRDGVQDITLDNDLRNLRSFFSTMANEELIARNPTQKIDRVKVGKKIKQPFTELEMERLRHACASRKGTGRGVVNVKRDLAILEVLYSTGCRVSELVGIRRKDINGENVKVLGKGNKERIVYLNPRAQIVVEDYLQSRKDDFEWLFPGGVWGEPDTVADSPIAIGTVEELVRKIGKKAGIEKCHPHKFRRTAATVALRRGMPIEQVGKMLGHEQLTTTQIYAVTADEDVQASHRKFLT